MGTIWYKADASALLKGWHRFIPDSSMTQSDQLNSIVRFGAYYSFIMMALTRNVRHAWMFALAAMLSVIVYESSVRKEGSETFAQNIQGDKCTQPTLDNPMMNHRPFEEVGRPAACKQWNVGDLSDAALGAVRSDGSRGQSINRFYTMPSTTGLSDQGKFADFLFGSMPGKGDVKSA
jgi:hypothetical protein